jgi:hypothetical protein
MPSSLVQRIRIRSNALFDRFHGGQGAVLSGYRDRGKPSKFSQNADLCEPGRCGRSGPAGLPIVLPTRCETIVNLKAAKSRGVAIATGILLRTREAIG